MELLAALIFIASALFLTRSEWEKLQLEVCHYEVPDGTSSKDAAGGRKYRLLFLSDLHEYLPLRKEPEKLLETIEKEKPDVVIIGGDMFNVTEKEIKTGRIRTGPALFLLKKLAEKYPVYCGEGNHEGRFSERFPEQYHEYVQTLRDAGVHYLAGESDVFPENGDPSGKNIRFFGISLKEDYYRHFAPGFGKKLPMDPAELPQAQEDGKKAEEKKTGEDNGEYRVFLLHHPLYLEEASCAGADLVLSGHMHGGTVRLWNNIGLMTPQYQFFVRECGGLHTNGRTAMVVNRGLGTHSIRIRFHNLPEISVIDIRL